MAGLKTIITYKDSNSAVVETKEVNDSYFTEDYKILTTFGSPYLLHKPNLFFNGNFKVNGSAVTATKTAREKGVSFKITGQTASDITDETVYGTPIALLLSGYTSADAYAQQDVTSYLIKPGSIYVPGIEGQSYGFKAPISNPIISIYGQTPATTGKAAFLKLMCKSMGTISGHANVYAPYTQPILLEDPTTHRLAIALVKYYDTSSTLPWGTTIKFAYLPDIDILKAMSTVLYRTQTVSGSDINNYAGGLSPIPLQWETKTIPSGYHLVNMCLMNAGWPSFTNILYCQSNADNASAKAYLYSWNPFTNIVSHHGYLNGFSATTREYFYYCQFSNFLNASDVHCKIPGDVSSSSLTTSKLVLAGSRGSNATFTDTTGASDFSKFLSSSWTAGGVANAPRHLGICGPAFIALGHGIYVNTGYFAPYASPNMVAPISTSTAEYPLMIPLSFCYYQPSNYVFKALILSSEPISKPDTAVTMDIEFIWDIED